MKRLSKVLAILFALALVYQMFGMTASAKDKEVAVADMQKSVVFIEMTVEFTAKNLAIQNYYTGESTPLSKSASYTGTGFAIGVPGEPVQYIATCDHVVEFPNGVYLITLDEEYNVLEIEQAEEGTSYPEMVEDEKKGLIYCFDYFEARTVELKAIYSLASNDSVSLSLIASNYEEDVALCKIATNEPTDKIAARPLRLKENVAVGDSVYAIGYPYTARYNNSEGRYDSADSVVTGGVISKIQLTEGHRHAKQQFYTYMIDANITNGNSGGPLFTKDGAVIGVNSFGHTLTEAAPANYAIAMESLIKLLDNTHTPYVLDDGIEETNMTLIIAIAAAAVVLIAAVIIVIALRNKQKAKNVPAFAASDAAMPEAVPAMAGQANFNVPPMQAGDDLGSTVVSDNTAAQSAPAEKEPSPAPAAAPASGKKYLLGISGPMEGKKYSIEDRAVIGRDSARCNVVFPTNQPGVSGTHCEVVRTGNVLSLKDLGSTYGTFLRDGTKITPNVPVVLKSGDQFIVGDKEIIFEVRY